MSTLLQRYVRFADRKFEQAYSAPTPDITSEEGFHQLSFSGKLQCLSWFFRLTFWGAPIAFLVILYPKLGKELE